MADGAYVSISGSTLSFLLYENIKSSGHQEGFLLGSCKQETVSTVTDSDIHNVQTKRRIVINAVFPLPLLNQINNNVGSIDRDKIKNYLKDKWENVVGWYRYHHSNTRGLALREKIVHKELSRLFNIADTNFSICILNSTLNDKRSVFCFNQTFFRYRNKLFEEIPLRIENLGDSYNTYKNGPKDSDSFSKLLKGVNTNTGVSSVQVIDQIQNAVQVNLNKSIESMIKYEEVLFNLEEEVARLRCELIERKQMIKDDRHRIDLTNSDNDINNLSDSNDTEKKVGVINDIANQSNSDHDVVMNNTNVEDVSKANNSLSKAADDSFSFVNDMKLEMSQTPVKKDLNCENKRKSNIINVANDNENSLMSPRNERRKNSEIKKSDEISNESLINNSIVKTPQRKSFADAAKEKKSSPMKDVSVNSKSNKNVEKI